MYVEALLIALSLVSEEACGQMPDVRGFCARVLESPLDPCDAYQCQSESIDQRSLERPEESIPSEKLPIGKPRRLQWKVLNLCAMGMMSRVVPDESIRTSSNPTGFHGKGWARLDQRSINGTSSGAWCPGEDDEEKWIVIDFGAPKEISGIITQGSPSEDHWITAFTVACGDAKGKFSDVKEYGSVKQFTGSSQRDGKAVNFFAEKMRCRYIRIHPQRWVGRPCLRLETLRGICYSPDYYSFYLESAGYDDGNNCKVLINGVDHADKGIGRGHCVVIFDAQTKEISAKAFDTWRATAETDDMVRFIESAPEHSVIAVAVKDATNPDRLTDQFSEVFRNLGAVGSTCPTQPNSRDAWAFIGQKMETGAVRPPWIQCKHVPQHGGRATLHATIVTSAHYDSWEDTPIA